MVAIVHVSRMRSLWPGECLAFHSRALLYINFWNPCRYLKMNKNLGGQRPSPIYAISSLVYARPDRFVSLMCYSWVELKIFEGGWKMGGMGRQNKWYLPLS